MALYTFNMLKEAQPEETVICDVGLWIFICSQHTQTALCQHQRQHHPTVCASSLHYNNPLVICKDKEWRRGREKRMTDAGVQYCYTSKQHCLNPHMRPTVQENKSKSH